MPPYFVLDYQISIPGFKLQVDGVQKRMHAALFKYAPKFATESIDVSSWGTKRMGAVVMNPNRPTRNQSASPHSSRTC